MASMTDETWLKLLVLFIFAVIGVTILVGGMGE